MASVNKCILIGNCGRDPEVRYAADGTAFANLSLACNEKWKDKNGEAQEKVEWVPVAFAGRIAEVVGEYVKKGDPIFVEGKFSTRKWQDKDGNDRYTSEVRAFSIRFLKGRDSEERESARPATKPASRPVQEEIGDDDVPF